MSGQQRQFITLNSIIYDYIDQSQQSQHAYARLWQIAYRGMEDLGIDFFYTIKSVKVPVLANKTCYLPTDCIRYTKIGVLNNIGEIIPLIYNSNFTLFGAQSSNRQQVTEDNNYLGLYEWDSNVWYNYWYNGAFTNVYGAPSGAPYQGSFNIDEANGVILLNEHFYFDYLMIEYVASPSPDKEYNIPVQFREALIGWLGWQDIQYKPSTSHFSNTEKAERKRNYFNCRRLSNARYRPLYLQDCLEWSLANTRLTIKS